MEQRGRPHFPYTVRPKKIGNMANLNQINCGTLQVPGNPAVVCHCLLLEDNGQFSIQADDQLGELGVSVDETIHADAIAPLPAANPTHSAASTN
jgi:hypothetical protein